MLSFGPHKFFTPIQYEIRFTETKIINYFPNFCHFCHDWIIVTVITGVLKSGNGKTVYENIDEFISFASANKPNYFLTF